MAFIGDQRTEQQIKDNYSLQTVLSNGAVWNNGAGGYVKGGKIVDTTPKFVPRDSPVSLANTNPAAIQQALSRGATNKAALAAGTVGGSYGGGNNYTESDANLNDSSNNKKGFDVEDYSDLSFDDLMKKLGLYYNFLSEDEINKQATSQVDADLASQIANLENQENTINSRYSPLYAALQTNLDKTEENALRSAHRRGLASSGIVDYERNKLDSAINSQLLGLQSQHATELENIGNTKTSIQNNRGNLINTAAASIRGDDLSKGTAMIASRTGIAQNLLDKLVVDAGTKYTTDANAVAQVGVTPTPAQNQNQNNTTTKTVDYSAAQDPYNSNQTSYLQNLKATGDSGQKEWANQQMYLRGLLNDPDPKVREWARQEISKGI